MHSQLSDEPMTTQNPTRRNQQIARSTIIVMVAFAVAKVISLVQTVILADVFGLSTDMDSYLAANALPETIFNLIAGGVLIHAFLPIFTGFLAKQDYDTAWRFASQVMNTVFLLTCIASILAFLAAPWIISNLIAPGMSEAAAQQTASIMQILLLSTVIFSVSGLLMGILNSFNQFLAPALAPALYDVGILFGAMFLVGPFGIYGLAYGTVLGALFHLLIQLPFVFRVGIRWRPLLGWADPTLRRMVRLMIPRMIDLGLFQITNWIVATNIASRLGESAISAYGWAWRIMQIPETLIGTAMGTVIFPTLAALSELGDQEGKRNALSGALRFILIGTIPSAVFLIMAGQTGISLLERGEFTSESTALVYNALRFFALGVVVHSILEVVARSFYADKDTWTPLLVAFGGTFVNIVSALVFTGVLNSDTPSPTGVGGLALANTLGVTFEAGALLFILRRRWYGIHENELARTTVKTLAASLVMGIAIVVFDSIWQMVGLAGQGMVMTIAQLAIEGIIGLVVFIAVAALLKMDEVKQLFSFLRRRSEVEQPVS
jgi:putative peptidoglycan lipid II flippase